MSVHVRGLSFVAFNLGQLSGPKLEEATKKGVEAMGLAAIEALKENTSRKDYTLQQLQNMDHPYASRHPGIQVHRPKTWVVHKRTSQMLNSIGGFPMTRKGKQKYRVGYIKSPPPHAFWVVRGTKVMHPRDTVRRTVNDPDVKKKMMKRVVLVLGKHLRSRAGLRFKF